MIYQADGVTKAQWLQTSYVFDSPLMEEVAATATGFSVIVDELLTSYQVFAVVRPDNSVEITNVSFNTSSGGFVADDVEFENLVTPLRSSGPLNFGTEEEPEWGFAKRITLIGYSATENRWISINDVTSYLAVTSICVDGEVRPTIISI